MPVSVHALAQRSAAGTRPAGASAPKKAARTAIARAVVAPESARPKEGPIIINGQVWTMGRGRGREREGGMEGGRERGRERGSSDAIAFHSECDQYRRRR